MKNVGSLDGFSHLNTCGVFHLLTRFSVFSWVEENCRTVLNIAATWVNPGVTAKGGPRTHFLITLLSQLFVCVSWQLLWIHSLRFPFLFSAAETSFWRGNKGTNFSFWVLSCWKSEFLNRLLKCVFCVERRIALCHQLGVANSELKLSGLGEVSWGTVKLKRVLCFWPTLEDFNSLCHQGLYKGKEKSLNHTEVEKGNFSSKQCLKCFGLNEGNKVLSYLWKGYIVLSFYCSSLLD